MIQKKVCMVGVYGTGKTCLVQRYVHSIFAVKYLSTVGVKIDRKTLDVHGHAVTLMLWDLEGRDESRNVSASYIRGAHGVIYVADGTRRDTVETLGELKEVVERAIGQIPSVVAFNKADLTGEWTLGKSEESTSGGTGLHGIRTSAKTGEGVEAMFQWLADATLASDGAAS
ncbi:MAG: Rab family GTPase [Gemmatimonadaceae bacterium]